MDQPEESEPKDLQTEENNDEMKAESIENCENEKISEDIEMSETATDTAVDNAEKKDIEEQSICENQEKYEENSEIQENPTENQIEGNENEEKMDKSEENSEKTPIAAKENTIEGTIIVGEKDDENDEAAEEDNDDVSFYFNFNSFIATSKFDCIFVVFRIMKMNRNWNFILVALLLCKCYWLQNYWNLENQR